MSYAQTGYHHLVLENSNDIKIGEKEKQLFKLGNF